MELTNPWMDVEMYLWLRWCMPNDDKWYEITSRENLAKDFLWADKEKAVWYFWWDEKRFNATLEYAKLQLRK